MFTSSGTFSKASYPWLRAIEAHVVGGGGAGGGANTTAAGEVSIGGGGGGGAYVRRWFTNISAIPASWSITVGGQRSGTAGQNGSAGNPSSLGAVDGVTVLARAGQGGLRVTSAAPPRFANGGQGGGAQFPDVPAEDEGMIFAGEQGWPGIAWALNVSLAGRGGPSGLGPQTGGSPPVGGSGNSSAVTFNQGRYGAGGNGARNAQNQSMTRTGGAGGQGIVWLDLYE